MLYTLTVPGPIEEVDEIRVLEWHGEAGHAFQLGELVVELETHKALVEVRAAQSGTLRQILCAEGEWQDIGMPLAVFSDDGTEPLPASTDELSLLAVDFEIT